MSDEKARPRTHHRQIRNFLLDRKVQLRVALVMVALTTLLTAALGWAWYSEIRTASSVIQINAIAALGPETAKSLEAELAVHDQRRLLLLCGFALLLALLVVAYGIVMTHKIAGPLFKIKRHIADIEAGRLYKLWGLRRGDQLQDFFAAFEAMHAALRSRVEADIELLNHLVAAVERGDDLKGELPRLKQVLESKGESLREAGQDTLQLKRPA
jgi:nitrogen fixation/metabolism regulation signal transduction histidine kinase